MEFKITTKYQHGVKSKNGRRINYRLYFLNDILIYRQRVPFDQTMELGCQGTYFFTNEYILNGNLYQTRTNDKDERSIYFPLSKKILKELGVPNDLKIEI
jgi:hypothetical protein